MKNPNRKTVSRLDELPNIGRAMATKLQLIGIDRPQQLIGQDAVERYDRLCRVSGQPHDPCVIDVFLSVIDFMQGGEPSPWWTFTQVRKNRTLR